jgi:predicted RNase H-like HicB family nuclease
MSTKKPLAHEETIVAFGRKFVCRFEHQAGRGYTATCPNYPDTVATGATLDEVRKHMRDELGFWLDAAYPPEPQGALERNLTAN